MRCAGLLLKKPHLSLKSHALVLLYIAFLLIFGHFLPQVLILKLSVLQLVLELFDRELRLLHPLELVFKLSFGL